MFGGLDAKGGGYVRFAGFGPTDQHDIVGKPIGCQPVFNEPKLMS